MEPGKSALKEKLRALAAENPEEAAKRRSGTRAKSAALGKVIKKAANIAELFDEDDLLQCVRVIREAMNATHRIFDRGTGRLIEVPNHKARLAAVALMLAYTEGLPVQRVVQNRVEMETGEEIMARLRESPAAMAALLAGQKAGAKWVIDGQVIDVEARVQEAVGANL